MYRNNFKRILDVSISGILILLLSPVYLILIILLFISYKRIFYTQLRVGKNLKTFKLFKFASMNELRDINGDLLPDPQRITNIGHFLRRFSMDELPQLFNVIKGDMSLVGPRPLLLEYIPLYDNQQIKRHTVLPGITGWAQVNGRNAISWKEKFRLDSFYVENLSFTLDIKILWLTIEKVLKRVDVNYNNDETMPRFDGNN